MTNFEKYRDKLMAISIKGRRVALVKQQPVDCHNISCTACDLYCEVPCDVERLKWLCEEYKEPAPKLTLEERYFCETFLEDDRLYLARDQYDNLYLYDVIKPPIKNVDSGYWALQDSDDTMLEIKKDFFSFIKWEDEKLWSIPDLLKLEVEK